MGRVLRSRVSSPVGRISLPLFSRRVFICGMNIGHGLLSSNKLGMLCLTKLFRIVPTPCAAHGIYAQVCAKLPPSICKEPKRKCGAPMTDPTITCPNCKTEIRLTESLAAPLIAATRSEFELRLAQQNNEMAKREQGIRDKEKQVVEARRELELTVEKRVQDGLAEVRAQAKREAEDGLKLKVMEKIRPSRPCSRRSKSSNKRPIRVRSNCKAKCRSWSSKICCA